MFYFSHSYFLPPPVIHPLLLLMTEKSDEEGSKHGDTGWRTKIPWRGRIAPASPLHRCWGGGFCPPSTTTNMTADKLCCFFFGGGCREIKTLIRQNTPVIADLLFIQMRPAKRISVMEKLVSTLSGSFQEDGQHLWEGRLQAPSSRNNTGFAVHL